MGSRTAIYVVAGMLILGVVVGARLMLREPSSTPDTASSAQQPAAVDLTPEAARTLFAQRATVRAAADAESPTETAYLSLGGQVDLRSDPAPLFLELFDDAVGTVVLTATARFDDGRTLPPTPLLILARTRDAAPGHVADAGPGQAAAPASFRDVFSAGGDGTILAPQARRGTATRVTVSFSASYFQATDMVFQGGLIGEAESLLAAYQSEPPLLWTPHNGADGQTRAFAARLENSRAKAIDGLFTVDLALDGDPAKVVAIADKAGRPLAEVTLRLTGRGPLLAGRAPEDLGYPDLAAVPLHGEDRLGTVFRRHEKTVAALLAGDPTTIPDSCTTLNRVLAEDAGLAAEDIETVLWSLTRDHALFADGVDYTAACSVAGALDGESIAPTATDLTRMHEALTDIGADLRYGADRNGQRVAARAAGRVVLVDRTGLWLPGAAGALAGETVTVAPDAVPDQVAELVGSLPVAHFACFSAGDGARGTHRAALVQLSHDSGLMVLDAAFGADNKIVGLSLAPADRAAVCRAVGKRKDGEGACYFARTGTTYNGIDPGKC